MLKEALSCTPPPDAATAVALQVALAHDHFWRGEFSQMRQVTGAVSSGGAGGAAPVIILSQVLASLPDLYLARIDEARAELAEAEKALAAAPDDVLGQNLMLSTQIALAACRLERFEAARTHVRRGLRVALEAVSTAAYWTGDVDRALSSAREAVACAQRTAEPFFVGMFQIQLAAARLAGGDAAGAHTQLAPVHTEPSRVLLELVGAHG